LSRLYSDTEAYAEVKGGDLIYRKALSYALSFGSKESGSSKQLVKNKATGDAHWMCNTLQGICISRGLRRCSSLTSWAMPEPLGVGRVTRLDSHAFLYFRNRLQIPFQGDQRDLLNNMAQEDDDYLIFTEVSKDESSNKKESNNEKLPIENKYSTLYEELVARCDPACFMEPYDKERVNCANEIYSQVLLNENSPDVLRQLRSRAIKELDVKFGTLYLYKELKRICNPKNFTGENYNADYLMMANNLYSQVCEYADDIEKLEEIEKQASDLIEIVTMFAGENTKQPIGDSP